MGRPSLAAWLCGGVVGAVLLVAAVAKLSHPRWAEQAPALGVSLAIARWVPWGELILGALLVTGIAYPATPFVAALVCAAFTVLVVRVLLAGQRPVCACFGGWSRTPLGAPTAVRNVGLTALATLAAVL